jgi:hypothetical protein
LAEYKLYCLDREGRIERRVEFEADGDEAAIAHARAEFSGRSCELWSGARKVALIPADGPPVLSRPAA